MFSDSKGGRNASSVVALWRHCAGDYACATLPGDTWERPGANRESVTNLFWWHSPYMGYWRNRLIREITTESKANIIFLQRIIHIDIHHEHRINDYNLFLYIYIFSINIKYQFLYSCISIILEYIIILIVEVISNIFRYVLKYKCTSKQINH